MPREPIVPIDEQPFIRNRIKRLLMAIKTSKQDLPTDPQQLPPRLIPDHEQRMMRINPELDARLTQFMENNSKSVEYCVRLVRENPDRAVRALMLNRMLKHEDQLRMVQRQLPQVQQWLDQQPGLRERIVDRIKNVNPLYRDKAFVTEVMRAKARLDFAPPKQSTGISV